MKKKNSSPTRAASTAGVDLEEIKRLLAFMNEHGLEECEYEHGGLRVRLKKSSSLPLVSASPAHVGSPAPTAAQMGGAPLAVQAPASVRQEEGRTTAGQEAVPAAPAEELHVVKSPIVGTYYESPSSNALPFVKVGDTIRVGQVLCIVEAMKLMNEIESDVEGELVRVMVKNGQPVEYGEPLFAVRSTRGQ